MSLDRERRGRLLSARLDGLVASELRERGFLTGTSRPKESVRRCLSAETRSDRRGICSLIRRGGEDLSFDLVLEDTSSRFTGACFSGDFVDRRGGEESAIWRELLLRGGEASSLSRRRLLLSLLFLIWAEIGRRGGDASTVVCCGRRLGGEASPWSRLGALARRGGDAFASCTRLLGGDASSSLVDFLPLRGGEASPSAGTGLRRGGDASLASSLRRRCGGDTSSSLSWTCFRGGERSLLLCFWRGFRGGDWSPSFCCSFLALSSPRKSSAFTYTGRSCTSSPSASTTGPSSSAASASHLCSMSSRVGASCVQSWSASTTRVLFSALAAVGFFFFLERFLSPFAASKHTEPVISLPALQTYNRRHTLLLRLLPASPADRYFCRYASLELLMVNCPPTKPTRPV